MNKCLTFSFLLMLCSMARAESILEYLTDANGFYIGPTLEDQVAIMDLDRNGFADVYEVRAYLEKQHGKGYQKSTLDRWQANSTKKSCGTTSFVDEITTQQN